MSKTTATAPTPAGSRGSVTRLTNARRSSPSEGRYGTEVSRARDARKQLRSRQERFAHLKHMHD